MTDDAGAANAAAEPVASRDLPASDTGQAVPIVDRTQETARASVDRAFASLEKQDGGPLMAEDADQGAKRDERGRFKAKQPEAGDDKNDSLEVPQDFSADAKSAWASVPESVKGETRRALKELNDGLNQYRQIVEPLKPYQQLAEKFGTTVHDTLERYVALDFALLSKQPEERMRAIERVLDHAGMTPRDYAAQITAQKSEGVEAGKDDKTVLELRQEIADLRNELGGLSKSFSQRHDDEQMRQVDAFARENPRLKEPELQGIIIRLLNAKIAPDLKGAYEMAVRLHPGPVKDMQPADGANAANRKAASQPRNGNLSISGAPGAGSNPARRKPPQSARESVDNAFTSLGIV